MKIIDSYKGILKLSSPFDMVQWRKYAGGIYPILPSKCESDIEDYDFQKQVLPVVNAALCNKAKLDEAHSSFCKVTSDLESKVRAKLKCDLDVDIVLYMGLCSGAGWATDIESRPTVLLGLEKIIELNWCSEENMAVLICHELGHLWHFATGTPFDGGTVGEQALWQLYSEGIAVFCEHLLSGMPEHCGREKNGWTAWCHSMKEELFAEYLRRVDANESVQDFFGDWCSYRGHSDVGYFLGGEMISAMAQSMPLESLARLDATSVYEALKAQRRD